MNFGNNKWRHIRAALLCGFAISGACSLYESFVIYTMVNRAAALDEIIPHMGDAERAAMRAHTYGLYFFTSLSLCFAYCLYLTRTRGEKPTEK